MDFEVVDGSKVLVACLLACMGICNEKCISPLKMSNVEYET
jgi:hypothetical protein